MTEAQIRYLVFSYPCLPRETVRDYMKRTNIDITEASVFYTAIAFYDRNKVIGFIS